MQKITATVFTPDKSVRTNRTPPAKPYPYSPRSRVAIIPSSVPRILRTHQPHNAANLYAPAGPRFVASRAACCISSEPELRLPCPIKILTMVGYNGGDQSTEINAAVWVLVGTSTLFLAARLWCRQNFSRISWDDLVLIISWVGYCNRTHIHVYPLPGAPC